MALQVTGLCPLIQVFDMVESVRFYCELLGFEVVEASAEVETPEGRFFHWCWLRLGPAQLMLNTAYDAGDRPPVRDMGRHAAHADTGLFFGCADVDAVHAGLVARGLALDPPKVTGYGMKQLYLRDPDGYELCFQAPAV